MQNQAMQAAQSLALRLESALQAMEQQNQTTLGAVASIQKAAGIESEQIDFQALFDRVTYLNQLDKEQEVEQTPDCPDEDGVTSEE